jgi:hypothetical protein
VFQIEDIALTFKLGNGIVKSDREWLKKKKELLEKDWNKNSSKVLRKIEDCCGCVFPEIARQEGIKVMLNRRLADNQLDGILSEENPLEINLFIARTDSINTLKMLLVRMLVYSFIHQQYEFHFRMREQTLFEDILADQLLAAKVSFIVTGKKLGRANCIRAVQQAIEQTVYQLSKKKAQNTLSQLAYDFFQEYPAKSKQKIDILTSREELIDKLLELLPRAANPE